MAEKSDPDALSEAERLNAEPKAPPNEESRNAAEKQTKFREETEYEKESSESLDDGGVDADAVSRSTNAEGGVAWQNAGADGGVTWQDAGANGGVASRGRGVDVEGSVAPEKPVTTVITRPSECSKIEVTDAQRKSVAAAVRLSSYRSSGVKRKLLGMKASEHLRLGKRPTDSNDADVDDDAIFARDSRGRQKQPGRGAKGGDDGDDDEWEVDSDGVRRRKDATGKGAADGASQGDISGEDGEVVRMTSEERRRKEKKKERRRRRKESEERRKRGDDGEDEEGGSGGTGGRGGGRGKKGKGGHGFEFDDDDVDDSDEWEVDSNGVRIRRKKRRGRKERREGEDDDGSSDDSDEWEVDSNGVRRRKKRGQKTGEGDGDDDDDDEWEVDSNGVKRKKQRGQKSGDGEDDDEEDDDEWEVDSNGVRRKKKKGAVASKEGEEEEERKRRLEGGERSQSGSGGDSKAGAGDSDEAGAEGAEAGGEGADEGGERRGTGDGADGRDGLGLDGEGGGMDGDAEGGAGVGTDGGADGGTGVDEDGGLDGGQGTDGNGGLDAGLAGAADGEVGDIADESGGTRKTAGWSKSSEQDGSDDKDGYGEGTEGTHGGCSLVTDKAGKTSVKNCTCKPENVSKLLASPCKCGALCPVLDGENQDNAEDADGEKRKKDGKTRGTDDSEASMDDSVEEFDEHGQTIRKLRWTIGGKGESDDEDDGEDDKEIDEKGEKKGRKKKGDGGDDDDDDENEFEENGPRIKIGRSRRRKGDDDGDGDDDEDGEGEQAKGGKRKQKAGIVDGDGDVGDDEYTRKLMGQMGTLQDMDAARAALDAKAAADNEDCSCFRDKMTKIQGQIRELNITEGIEDEEEEDEEEGEDEEGGGEAEVDFDDGDTDEDEELVVLDPDHPLMIRFQRRLKEFLAKLDETLTINLREVTKNIEEAATEEEDTGKRVKLWESDLAKREEEYKSTQQKLGRSQMKREDADDTLKELKFDYDLLKRAEIQDTKDTESKQKDVENSSLKLYYASENQVDKKGEIDVQRRAAMKGKQVLEKLAPYKSQQDHLVDRWLHEGVKLEEEVAMFENLTLAQIEETKAAKEAINEAKTELGAIRMEKKEIMHQWQDSLLLTKKRDEAKEALNEAIESKKREEKKIKSEVEGYKRNIVSQHKRNEQLALQVNRAESELATFEALMATNEEAQDEINREYATKHKVLQQTELNLNRTRIERGEIDRKVRDLMDKIDAVLAKKRAKEDEIERLLQEQLIYDNQANHVAHMTEDLRWRTRHLEKEAAILENELMKKDLEITSLEVVNKAADEKMLQNSAILREKDKLMDTIETEFTRRASLIERKQVGISLLMHKLATDLDLTGGEELGPFEVHIKQMSKSIDELNGKTVKTQERWLRLQNQLVAWQQKFEDIDAEVLLLGKTIMISEKTKIRTEKVIESLTREIEEMEKSCDTMRIDEEQLNLLLYKTTQDQEQANKDNILVEEFAYRELEELERKNIQMKERLRNLDEKKRWITEDLNDANSQVLLWEKKIQIQKEMKLSVDKLYGQGELGMMKSEVQRMEYRFGRLKKQQELLIQDMEKAVSRRESIHARGSKPFKPWEGKSSVASAFMRENQEIKNKILKFTKETENSDEELKRIQMKRDDLAHDLHSKNIKVAELRCEREGYENKQRNLNSRKSVQLQRLVSDQQKNKWYDQIKQKKYIPIFKTDTAIDIEYQKQLNCLHGLSNIVQKIRSEHKDNSNLQTATATLEMTIEDKVMQKQSY